MSTSAITESKCTFIDNPKEGELNFKYSGRVETEFSGGTFDERKLRYIEEGPTNTRLEVGISNRKHKQIETIIETMYQERLTKNENLGELVDFNRSTYPEFAALLGSFPEMSVQDISRVNGVGTYDATATRGELDPLLRKLMEYVEAREANPEGKELTADPATETESATTVHAAEESEE